MPRKDPYTHLAWDQGSIVDAFAEIFGEEVRPIITTKTTKTYCGKRVKMEKIDNEEFTCPICEEELQREKAWRAKAAELSKKYKRK